MGDDGEALIIAHDTAITDENGKVTFEIQPEVQHNKVTITVSYYYYYYRKYIHQVPIGIAWKG